LASKNCDLCASTIKSQQSSFSVKKLTEKSLVSNPAEKKWGHGWWSREFYLIGAFILNIALFDLLIERNKFVT